MTDAIRYMPTVNCEEMERFTGCPHEKEHCGPNAPWYLPNCQVAEPGDWIVADPDGEVRLATTREVVQLHDDREEKAGG